MAIEATGLSRSFDRGEARITAVDGITLQVPPGQIVAVTGRSGSGKSTLLHLLGAIERADAGSIVVDGTGITAPGKKDLTRYRRTVGFVFQRFHLLPALTVLDNVLAPVLPRRTPYDKHARARELLDAVGLADRAHAHPAQLSGGQQQRVALARALVAPPAPAARRRTHRRPRLGHRSRRHGPHRPAGPRARHHRPHRRPRTFGGGGLPARPPHARRPRRLGRRTGVTHVRTGSRRSRGPTRADGSR
ncbi:ATP-binding cassette domain-containing protein [Streptomyces sp. R301]|uniref:ABC transporter ATP-binding protein n=1 Tax=unclassified Streptomyces TaxID=2593676 RepID=UPI003211D81D